MVKLKKKTDKEKKSKRVGLSTREKMIQRKEELLKKNTSNSIIFIKEGVTRIRVKSPGEDKELGLELIQFYLQGVGTIISPATFDEPCPFMETYKKLKDSSKESDKEVASKLVPKRKYVIGGIGYKDTKGKEVDPDRVDKAFMIARSLYQDLIDLYLDEDDFGDMTDPDEGYDIKITRTGTGQLDTNYKMDACPKKPLSREFKGEIDLEGIVKAQIKSYDELEVILNNYLNNSEDDEDNDDDDTPSKRVKPKKKLKKNRGDI